MGCRTSPVGKKQASVRVFPATLHVLEIAQIDVFAEQERSWTGTKVTVQLTCPGMRQNRTVKFANGTTYLAANQADQIVGKYKGSALCLWPNGQRLEVSFFYDIVP